MVVREYGLPDKRGSDENGGEVFAYEKETIKTNTKASENVRLYGIYGVSSVSNMNSNSTTIRDKQFVNFFFDKNGKVYDYKSNYGAIFKTEKQLNKSRLWLIGSPVLGVLLGAALGLSFGILAN